MSRTNKITLFSLLALITLFLFSISACADSPKDDIMNQINDEIQYFKKSLPKEIIEFFPKEIWEGDFSKLLGSDISEVSILNLILNYLLLGLNNALKSFSSITVILLISSLLDALCFSKSNAVKNSFNIASTICVSISIFKLCTSIATNTSDYLSSLSKIMECFAPLMATLYILTGNVTTGTVASASFVLFISLVENFLLSFMLPIVNICICFSIIKSIGGYFDLSGISKILKNTFTGITVFVMSIFMFILSCKSILSQSTDSISIKTAKFAISSFIPIVGSTVNDALRTITSSISLIKNSCGIIAIIIIAIIMIPSIISLLLNKLLFSITSSIAKCLNCNAESYVIEEASSICGFLLALVICTCILFIFALTIMIKTTVVI
jgi:stage III sporulation protein AE